MELGYMKPHEAETHPVYGTLHTCPCHPVACDDVSTAKIHAQGRHSADVLPNLGVPGGYRLSKSVVERKVVLSSVFLHFVDYHLQDHLVYATFS
ncbi:hypothetical protein KM043_015792 [Ampulex compressa]|nr:hypothetical protein KM043_015792 [Ampulex compressa]